MMYNVQEVYHFIQIKHSTNRFHISVRANVDFSKIVLGCAMAQAVSHRSHTLEAWGHTWVSPCGICGGQSGTGTGISASYLFFPVNVIPPWLSIFIYYLRHEQ
jgi:hypothetical protein